MSKINYSGYELGQEVYAISRRYSDGKPTDSVSIYKARVSSVTFEKNPITGEIEADYMLKTPNGECWGDSVGENEIGEYPIELVNYMLPEWIRNSNNHGEE